MKIHESKEYWQKEMHNELVVAGSPFRVATLANDYFTYCNQEARLYCGVVTAVFEKEISLDSHPHLPKSFGRFVQIIIRDYAETEYFFHHHKIIMLN